VTGSDLPPGKLVRDRIPEIIAATGRTASVRRLDPTQLRLALRDKLLEEATEVHEAAEDELEGEVADVLEVLRTLAREHGIRWQDVEATAAQKACERGAFTEGLYLDADIDAE